MALKEIIRESAKNIIKTINPGRADISKIGDGTIKGAIIELNSKLSDELDIKSDFTKIVKKDNVVHFSQYIAADVNAGNIIYTLPQNLWPRETISKSFWLAISANEWATTLVTISNNTGTVTANRKIYRGEIEFTFLTK